jgi:hypothetical protein
MRKFLKSLSVVVVALASSSAWALAGGIELETGFATQSRNDVRIPSTGGTDVSITQGALLPFVRVQATLQLAERHELRALWAPYNVRGSFTPTGAVNFNGENFAANVPIDTQYQFNSYRLTYRYRISADDARLYLAAGVTVKIRDAYIRFTQGPLTTVNANVGPVPLLHVHLRYRLCEQWDVLFDIDGLAAPAGRAFDAYLGARYSPSESWYLGAGYRTLEGGASNDTIRNFTWLHYFTLTGGVRL